MTVLRERFHIKQQYLRSANVERDLSLWLTESNGYVLTPIAVSSLERILRGMKPGGQRAWAIVGPYGSGKSSLLWPWHTSCHPRCKTDCARVSPRSCRTCSIS